MLEDLTDVLKSHAFDFGIAEVDGNPAEGANCSVEAEGAGRSGVLHLSEEGAGDDDVATPAGAGEDLGRISLCEK